MNKPYGMKLLRSLQTFYPDLNITSLEDGKSRIVFEVKKSHCKLGTPRNPGKCPGALAIRDATGVDAAFVRTTVTVLVKKGHALRYRNTEGLRDAVVQEDLSKSFIPGIYAIYPVAPSGRLNKIRAKPQTTNNKSPEKHKTRMGGQGMYTAHFRDSWQDPKAVPEQK